MAVVYLFGDWMDFDIFYYSKRITSKWESMDEICARI